jgi:hypothetical protein
MQLVMQDNFEDNVCDRAARKRTGRDYALRGPNTMLTIFCSAPRQDCA